MAKKKRVLLKEPVLINKKTESIERGINKDSYIKTTTSLNNSLYYRFITGISVLKEEVYTEYKEIPNDSKDLSNEKSKVVTKTIYAYMNIDKYKELISSKSPYSIRRSVKFTQPEIFSETNMCKIKLESSIISYNSEGKVLISAENYIDCAYEKVKSYIYDSNNNIISGEVYRYKEFGDGNKLYSYKKLNYTYTNFGKFDRIIESTEMEGVHTVDKAIQYKYDSNNELIEKIESLVSYSEFEEE